MGGFFSRRGKRANDLPSTTLVGPGESALSQGTALQRSGWRRLRNGTVLSIALLVMGGAGWSAYDNYHRQLDRQILGSIVSKVPMREKLIALTFDDGPSPANTEALLAVLARHQVRATFFMIGRHIEQHPAIARSVMLAGHQIGNHSYSHSDMTWMTPGTTADEIDRTAALIRGLGYRGAVLFRSPYGKKFLTLPYALWQRGTTNVTWTVSTGDWANQDVATLVERAATGDGSGGIVLFHDGNEHADPARPGTIAAVDEVIRRRKAEGYRFVTVDELIAAGDDALRSPEAASAEPL